MANKFELPKNPVIAGKIVETEHAARIAEMGRIGAFFGSRENASVYLAALVVLLAVIFCSVIAYSDAALRPDALKALLGLAATALGFMFGSGSTRRD
jgi:hypothetical protein